MFGYSRGWFELKQDYESYGAQIALDCQIDYDSTSFASLTDNIMISRLALWLGKENRRIIIGKQKVYWGGARDFRPLDILNPTNYFEPGYERHNTNAILGYYSISDLSSLRAIVQPKFNPKQSLYGMRFGTNLLRNDIGLNLLHRNLSKMTIIGAEITGEAEIGYWTEMNYSWFKNEKYFKTSVGFDYSFPFYLCISYRNLKKIKENTEKTPCCHSERSKESPIFTVERCLKPFTLLRVKRTKLFQCF